MMQKLVLHLSKLHALLVLKVGLAVLFVVLVGAGLSLHSLQTQVATKAANEATLRNALVKERKDLADLKKQDQYVINQDLKKEIANIQHSYNNSVISYESYIKIRDQIKTTDTLDGLFAKTLSYLTDKNFASADATLVTFNNEIQKENNKLAAAAAVVVPQNVPSSNAAPGNGYSRQQVASDIGTFMVDLIAGDLGSTKVIVDTASDSDCRDNCPVLSLADYVARSGAYAGINGSYFCPASYPSCAGKTNSFDLLVMNKNKHYFNSDNNVYSTNPAVIFQGGSVRFVGKALEWGRDTGVDGVLSNFPLLVSGGNVAYDTSSDPKFNSKGARNFVANKGNTVYIGIVYNADMRDSAHVLKALGMDNAMNLDEGGSTALWYAGYKAGPGRGIPNAILFVRK